MKRRLMKKKLDRLEESLLRDIDIFIKTGSKIFGVNKSWFKFAKKTKYGCKFLKNKEKQFAILENLAFNLSKKYKLFTTGQIVDLISEFVNK